LQESLHLKVKQYHRKALADKERQNVEE